MQQYNMIKALFMSFYSRKIYKDVALNWGGKAFLYLFFILALSWIYFAFTIQHYVDVEYPKLAAIYVPQIPVLTYKNGVLSTPENRPYFVTDPESHNNLMVIDATGKYKTLEDAKAPVLITQTEVINQSDHNGVKITEVSNKFNMVIDPQWLNAKIIKFMYLGWPLFFPLLVIGSYFYRFVQLMLYSILGKIFVVIFNVKLTYPQILQISMVAITPAIVVNTIMDICGFVVPHLLLIYFVLAMLYIFRGIIVNKE